MGNFVHSIGRWLYVVSRGTFYALPGIVAFILCAFGVGVLYMNELQDALKDQKAKRWFAAAVFVILGILAFTSDLVQKAQDKAEITHERADSKKEREDSQKDRQTLMSQNSQLIAFGQSQITKDDLTKTEGNLLKGISGVNTAVKDRPAPVPEIQPLPPPTVEHTRFTYRRAASTDPEYPFGLQIIISSDVKIDPVGFAIECTGEVGKVSFFVTGQGAYMMTYAGPAPNNPNVAIVKFAFPALQPETPLVVTIFSKTDIRVKQLAKLQQ
jgi:hypothetical protein